MVWALLALLLSVALPCTAATWTSNALMQPLELIATPPSSGYYLVEEGNRSTLYLDGNVVRTRTVNGEAETTTENGVTTRRVFSEGNLMEETLADGTLVQYSYSEEGNLERVSYTREGEVERVVQYNYSPRTGLAAVIDITEGNAVFYSGSAMAVRSGESSRRLERSQLEREVITGLTVSEQGSVNVNEDHSLTIREPYGDGERVSEYDEALVLRSESILDSGGNEVSRTTYSYSDDGRIESATTSEGTRRTVDSYSSGRLATREVFDGDVPTMRREMQLDGTITETRYRNGSEYALVRYDRDGVRVLEVRML